MVASFNEQLAHLWWINMCHVCVSRLAYCLTLSVAPAVLCDNVDYKLCITTAEYQSPNRWSADK